MFYLEKNKTHCGNFQLVVCLTDGLIVWCPKTGLPSSIVDITALGLHDFISIVKCGEVGLADLGYLGMSCLLISWKRVNQKPLSSTKVLFNKVHASVRIIVEHTLGRIKHWDCLDVPWRHDFFRLCQAFYVIASFTNITIHQNPIHTHPTLILQCE